MHAGDAQAHGLGDDTGGAAVSRRMDWSDERRHGTHTFGRNGTDARNPGRETRQPPGIRPPPPPTNPSTPTEPRRALPRIGSR